jgi:hypothetical protein
VRTSPTPPNITKLKARQIFVFGSNEGGIHGKGAALTAKEKFGAWQGTAFGMMGDSFGIPTKSARLKVLPLSVIRYYVDYFIWEAAIWTQHEFFVTEIGCGLAGYTPREIAPLFKAALDAPNIHLPESFLKVLLVHHEAQ